MSVSKCSILFLAVFAFQFIVQSQSCNVVDEYLHTIHDRSNEWRGYKNCWTIPVRTGTFAYLRITQMSSEFQCSRAYVTVIVADSGEAHSFCSSDIQRYYITALSNVTVTHHIKSYNTLSYSYSSFTLEYSVKDIQCVHKDSFHCDNHTCIAQEEVCDGIKDCKNGADEVGCETGVFTIEGVLKSRTHALSWLKSQRTEFWGWGDDTPRANVALYLASDANFNGTILEEELMAKQAELKATVALLRSSLADSELSMFINSLLVTCHNPRKFHGNNLVKRLKQQVERSQNLTNPVAYLALCNANESWPMKAVSDLENILSMDSDYPFVKDIQAVAVIALSCLANNSNSFNSSRRSINLYRETTKHFKKLQLPDGSFGNVYTTAFITQALLSSGQDESADWNLNATIQYLMKELNSSSIDFLSTYLILPILNSKSLMDISKVNCSSSLRKHKDDPISEINQYLQSKIRVQYSLYIGDKKDVIHTISLRVPENYTVSEVMALAEVEDPKYKFEWKAMTGKMYVYEIANVTNDPEASKFWLLYVGTTNNTESLAHLTTSPDTLTVSDGEHLVMWYRTVTL